MEIISVEFKDQRRDIKAKIFIPVQFLSSIWDVNPSYQFLPDMLKGGAPALVSWLFILQAYFY